MINIANLHNHMTFFRVFEARYVVEGGRFLNLNLMRTLFSEWRHKTPPISRKKTIVFYSLLLIENIMPWKGKSYIDRIEKEDIDNLTSNLNIPSAPNTVAQWGTRRVVNLQGVDRLTYEIRLFWSTLAAQWSIGTCILIIISSRVFENRFQKYSQWFEDKFLKWTQAPFFKC